MTQRPMVVRCTAAAAVAAVLAGAGGPQPRVAASPAPRRAAAPPRQTAAAPLTLQDLEGVVRLSDLVWAPDGASLAFTSTPLLAGPARAGSDIWLVEPGRGARALTRDAQADRAGDFNASGTHLSLSSRRGTDATEQGWLWDRHDGALHPLAKVPGGLMTPPTWAPDGSWLAAIARAPSGSGGPRGPDAVGVEYGRVVLFDPGGASAQQPPHLPAAAALAWSAQGKTLALIARDPDGRRGLALAQWEAQRPPVRWLPRPLHGELAADPPAWSPDGTRIAARVQLASGGDEVCVWWVERDPARAVPLSLTERCGPPLWKLDGSGLLIPLRDGLRVHLAEVRARALIDAAGAELPRDDGTTGAERDPPVVRVLTDGLECVGSLERSRCVARGRGGDRVAFVRSSPRAPDEIFVLEPTSPEPPAEQPAPGRPRAPLHRQPEKLTAFHTALLRKGLGSVEAAQLPAPAGPRPALLTYPPAAVAPRAPWPALIVLDTGSAAPAAAGFDVLSQLACGTGCLVMRAEWPHEALAAVDTATAALTQLRARGLANAATARWAGPPERVQQLVRTGRIPADSFLFPATEALDRRALERMLVWLGSAHDE